jgi:hypothetical protein
LTPAQREALDRVLEWLRPLAPSTPAGHQLFLLIQGWAKGAAVQFTDYRGPMMTEQASWRLGGSASQHWQEFQLLFPDEVRMAAKLRYGMEWAVEDQPLLDELIASQQRHRHNPPHRTPEQRASLESFVSEGEREGFCGPPLNPSAPGLISNIFSIVKSDGINLRWLLNLKPWNDAFHNAAFRCGGMRGICQTIERDAWCTWTDLRKFYWIFRMSSAATRLQRFHDHNGVVKEMYVVVMGAKPSAQQTSAFLAIVLRRLRTLTGVTTDGYIDEIFTHTACPTFSFAHHCVMMLTFHILGIPCSWEKDNFRGSQSAVHLGWTLHTPTLRLRPTHTRVVQLMALAADLLQVHESGGTVTVRHKASFLGTMASCADGVWRAGFDAAPLKDELRLALQRHGFDNEVPTTTAAAEVYRTVLAWTAEDTWSHARRQVPIFTFTTDASEEGWAGEIFRWLMASPPPCALKTLEAEGHFRPGETKADGVHHNTHEWIGMARYVRMIVQQLDLRGTPEAPICIEGEQDNATVVSALRKLSTRSRAIAALAIPFFQFLNARHLQVAPTYIDKETMDTERVVDSNSRKTTRWWEWQLRLSYHGRLISTLGLTASTMVDLFCEDSTAVTPLRHAVTKSFCPEALWNDAFSRSWDPSANPALAALGASSVWAFPPPKMLSRVRTHLTDMARASPPQHVQSMIILLHLSNADTDTDWFLQHRVAKPLLVGPLDDLLQPPETTRRATDSAPATWMWMCVHISTTPGAAEAYQSRLSSSGGSCTVMTRPTVRLTGPGSEPIVRAAALIRERCLRTTLLRLL